MTPKTIEEWNALNAPGPERMRAFNSLPPEEQAKLHSPADLASYEAAERYSGIADKAYAELGQLLRKGGEEVALFCYLLTRVQAANELRCAMSRCSRPSLEDTFGPNGPFELINRAGVEGMRKTILREVMS